MSIHFHEGAVTRWVSLAPEVPSDDGVFRFVRECQVAAGAFVPPTNSVRILTAAASALRSFPESVPSSVREAIAAAISGLARRTIYARPDVDAVRNGASSRAIRESIAPYVVNALLAQHHIAVLSLRDVALEVGISPSYVSLAIHSVTGRGFRMNLSVLRVLRAISLLTESRVAIAAIAKAAGYHHTAELDRDFKKWLRVSPRQLRKWSIGGGRRIA